MSKPSTISRTGFWAIVALILAAGLFHLLHASADYPIWDGDAVGFWPYVASYAKEQRWSNPLYDGYLESLFGIQPNENTYPHGFLTPLLLARLSGGDYHSLRLAMAMAHLVSLTFLLAAVARVLPASANTAHRAVIFVLVAAIFTWSCADLGRPESFTCLPVCMGLWIVAGRRFTRTVCLALGVGSGIVFWFNPVPGALLTAMIGTLILTERGTLREKLIHAALFAVATVVSGVAIFAMLYQGSPERFFTRFLSIGKGNLARSEASELFRCFLMHPGRPLLLVTLLAGGLVLFRRIGVNTPASPERWLSCLIAGIFLLVGWMLGFRSPPRNYVFVPLLPAILFLSAPLVCQAIERRKDAAVTGWVVTGLLALGAVANLAAIAGDAARFQSYRKHGVRLQTTTDVVREMRAAHPGARLGVSSALFPCVAGDPLTVLDDPAIPRTADFLLLQQVNRGSTTPAQIPGYTLVRHSFVTQSPRMIVSVGRLTPSYAAALYERTKGAP